MPDENKIKITPDVARAALYRMEGMIASDDGMIIENALTLWEEQFETIRQQAEEIVAKDEEIARLRGVVKNDGIELFQLRKSVQQSEEARKAAEAELVGLREELEAEIRVLKRELSSEVYHCDGWRRIAEAAEREARNERELSESIVAEREEAIIECEQLRQHKTALRECLTWYADIQAYPQPESSFPARVLLDRGNRARTLLAELDRTEAAE